MQLHTSGSKVVVCHRANRAKLPKVWPSTTVTYDMKCTLSQATMPKNINTVMPQVMYCNTTPHR